MTDTHDLISLTADIVSAHVSSNNVATTEVAMLIHNVHEALKKVGEPVPETVDLVPAVPVRSSVRHDYLVCLEDGAKLKMLKRYLRTNYDMSPEEYRVKWGLPRDYPMVAPAYAETRRALAHTIGLGRKKEEVETPAPVEATAPVKAKRATKAQTPAAPVASVKPTRRKLGVRIASDKPGVE